MLSALLAAAALAHASPAAQQDLEQVEIQTVHVSGLVYMLVGGRGGNIGLLIGDDGPVLIDDQLAPLTPKVLAAVKALAPGDVRFVINTHWHFDHTGGNETLGRAGAILVAHENTRRRMSTEQFLEFMNHRVPASPPEALPVVTFTEQLTLHWNGETVRVLHVENAHTDSDAIIHFEGADVFHMGDTFLPGMYPFIDLSSGGSIQGMIAAADVVLAQAGETTRIVPGHGPLSTAADLRRYRDMLVAVRDRVQALVREGRSEDEVLAAKPSAAFDADWGQGYIPPDAFVRFVYASLAARR
jgi:glyoxylase-like metal-dependent hydrolase (beta-lactamase superfamily II)